MKTASLQDDERLQLCADSASLPDCARLRHVSHFCGGVHRLSPQSDVLITAWYRVRTQSVWKSTCFVTVALLLLCFWSILCSMCFKQLSG